MKQKTEKTGSEWLRQGFRAGIPICLGYFAVAIALGINCRNAGMSALQSGVMSVFMLTFMMMLMLMLVVAMLAGMAHLGRLLNYMVKA